MSRGLLNGFSQVWCVDYEFRSPPGERPDPICMVAHELNAGRTLRLWEDVLKAQRVPPYPLGPEALFVAYYASAELGCHIALGWPMPARILDLYAEFRCQTSGLRLPCGNGLLGALTYYGLDAMEGAEKDSMRDLAIRGGPYTELEKQQLLDYCETDVVALAKLLPKIVSR